MTHAEIEQVLSQIAYKDWQFYLGEARGVLFLQIRFISPDSATREIALQSGRKWLLSPFMTPSEVVQTALKAVLTAVEHEARERFLYRGVAVFGPHIDVESLLVAARKEDRRRSDGS
jgi:hypothetical protein